MTKSTPTGLEMWRALVGEIREYVVGINLSSDFSSLSTLLARRSEGEGGFHKFLSFHSARNSNHYRTCMLNEHEDLPCANCCAKICSGSVQRSAGMLWTLTSKLDQGIAQDPQLWTPRGVQVRNKQVVGCKCSGFVAIVLGFRNQFGHQCGVASTDH